MRIRVETAEPTDIHFEELSDLLEYADSMHWNGKQMFDYYAYDDDGYDVHEVCYDRTEVDAHVV